MIAAIKRLIPPWVWCLIWGHDLHEHASCGVTFWRCRECGKWSRR